MRRLWIAALLASGAAALLACQPSSQRTAVMKDVNGMVLGNDNEVAQLLVAGVGDSVAKLLQRNPFLKDSGLSESEVLRLPLMTKLSLRYDDDDLKLDVGCVSRANVDGDDHFSGAAFIGMKLCDVSLNDWKSAVDQATRVMRRFEEQNPHAKDLREFYLSASEPQLQALGGKIWRKSDQDLFALLTPEQAGAKFAREEQGNHEEILSGHRRNTLANVGVYAGKKALFEIAVSKTQHFGGSNLSETQRRTMRYEITMSFRLRNDVNPSALSR